MLNCRRLKAACHSGTLITGLVLIGFLVPRAFATSGGDEDLQRFFDPLPPEVLAEYAPHMVGGDKYAQTTTANGEGVEQFEELPIESVTPIITGVSNLGGLPEIEFRVVDQFGFGVEGFRQLENVEFEFTVNKLIPPKNGKTARWRTYVRTSDEGVPRIAPSAVVDGTLEDLGDGNYRFTFDQGLEDISGVRFQPQLTHRVGMEVRDPAPFGEEVEGSDTAFDVLPATGETEEDGIMSKMVITQENCSVCHGTEEFAFHGGPRQRVKQCVSCHQPNTRDAFSGNTLDFGIMIHKIHNAQNLTDLPYQFCGFGCENFGAPPDDFSHVVYPQSVKNCTTCHNPDNPETPDASNINDTAVASTCASCHDDLAFDSNGLTNANGNHLGLAQPNDTCEACHSPNGLLQGNLAYHTIPSQAAAQEIAYEILDISNTEEGQSPVVTFRVFNPIDGTDYDLMTAPAFNSDGTSVNMTFAWPTSDFTNVGNDAGTELAGSVGGRPASLRIAGSSGPTSYVIDNGDGTYTLDSGMAPDPVVIPATNPPLGSGQVGIEGHPAADLDGDGEYESDVPVTNVVQAFPINDASASPRRVVVSIDNCQACHNVNDGLAFHGGNRTDNVQHCVECHNPNATDINRRVPDPDGVANGVNMATPDGLEDQTVNMAYMIHAIHAASVRAEDKPYIAYGFRSSVHDYSDASYPRSPAECQACHTGDTYQLPLGSERLATTIDTGATAIEGGFAPSRSVAEDPTDDNNVSAETAACVSCHNSDTAIDHMSVRSDSGISFGNGWLMNPNPITDPDTQAFIDSAAPENCAFCHSEGSFVPVSEVHGVN